VAAEARAVGEAPRPPAACPGGGIDVWSTTVSVKPPVDAPRGVARPLVLFSLGLGFLVLALDNLMVTGAGPTIAGEFRGLELIGWLFTAFLLTWTVTGPLFGKLADLYGRRPVLLVGLGIHAAGSLLAGCSQAMEQVIAARLVQGVGAGAIQTVAYTAGADLFPPAQRARAQALFTFVYLVAAVAAPLLTGLLVDRVSWRAIFLVDIVLAAAASGGVGLTLREPAGRRPARLDLAGAAALIVGAGALLLALAEVSRTGQWNAPVPLGLSTLALAGAVAFFWLEGRAADPLVPLALFRNRIVLGSCLVVLAMAACLWSYNAFVPVLVQGVLGGGPFQASLVSLPINAAWLVANLLAMPLLWRWSYRKTCLAGMLILGAGYVILALVGRGELGPGGGFAPAAYALVLLGMAVQGVGLGFVNTAAVVAVQNAVPWSARGTATAAAQFFRSFGPAVVISVLQVGMNARLASELAARGLPPEQLAGAPAGGSLANALLAPALQASLSPAALASVQQALEVALHQTFWLLVGVAALGGLLAGLLPGGHPETHVWRAEPQRAGAVEHRLQPRRGIPPAGRGG